MKINELTKYSAKELYSYNSFELEKDSSLWELYLCSLNTEEPLLGYFDPYSRNYIGGCGVAYAAIPMAILRDIILSIPD